MNVLPWKHYARDKRMPAREYQPRFAVYQPLLLPMNGPALLPRFDNNRLSRINDSLARKVASRNEYDKTIMETEAAYMKILESSQTLLHVLKRESVSLTKKKQASN